MYSSQPKPQAHKTENNSAENRPIRRSPVTGCSFFDSYSIRNSRERYEKMFGTKMVNLEADLQDTPKPFAPPILINETQLSARNTETFFFSDSYLKERRSSNSRVHMLAMLGHDLKTPLTSIQHVLELLSAGTLGELNQVGHGCLERATRNLSKLIELIDTLLDCESGNSGRTCIELSSVISTAVELIQDYASCMKVEVKHQPTDVRLTASETGLTRVIVNLLSNAIKYAPPGSAISLEVRRTDENVEIRVSDQGRGVPEARMDSIFDCFAQGAPGDELLGHGLGLYICKLIVVNHEGKIGVRKNEKDGVGSVFWFQIPTEEDEEVCSHAQPKQPRALH